MASVCLGCLWCTTPYTAACVTGLPATSNCSCLGRAVPRIDQCATIPHHEAQRQVLLHESMDELPACDSAGYGSIAFLQNLTNVSTGSPFVACAASGQWVGLPASPADPAGWNYPIVLAESSIVIPYGAITMCLLRAGRAVFVLFHILILILILPTDARIDSDPLAGLADVTSILLLESDSPTGAATVTLSIGSCLIDFGTTDPSVTVRRQHPTRPVCPD